MRAAAEGSPSPHSTWTETRWLEPVSELPRESLAEATRRGLTTQPKELPSQFFYDDVGSRLFEEICDLPEYYLTRAETEILENASVDLAERLPEIETLVELGSGSAVKTEHLLRAFTADRKLRYAPIDVSKSALEESVSRLEERHSEIGIAATVAEYESGIAAIEGLDLGPKLLLWLGSSIGNLRRTAASDFLSRRRKTMSDADRMLVGIDLRKDSETLERAYNDRQGVTARFNLNVLARINRELDADFDIDRFAHRVHFDQESGSVQSFVESSTEQSVRIDRLDLDVQFEAGERIHTEDSFKYSFEEIADLAESAGLRIEHRYLDDEERFSLNLLAPR